MNLNEYVSHCPSCAKFLNGSERDKGECYECGREFSAKQRQFALENPELYLQKINLPNSRISTVIELADERITGRILNIYGVWAVTDFGIECFSQGYPIGKHRLLETDWVSHMSEKSWVDINDFTKAFERAKEEHKNL